MQELRERVRQQVGTQQEAEILAAEAEFCPTCIRHFLRSLQVRLVGVSGDEGLHDALRELGLG